MSGMLWTMALAALLGFWCLGAHNRLVRLRHAVGQAWAAVDVQLQRRHAHARELAERLAVPEAQPALGDELALSAVQMLTAAVRQAEAAAAHARPRPARAGAIQSLALAEQVLDNALRPLDVLIAARARRLQRAGLYEALHELHGREAEIEAQAAFARRLFNATVAEFNVAIDEMPTRLLAGPMRFAPAALFQTASDEPRLPWPEPTAELVTRPALLALPVIETSTLPAPRGTDTPTLPAPRGADTPTLPAPGGVGTPALPWPATTIDLSSAVPPTAGAGDAPTPV